MEIGQKVKIINTGDIWENKTGILEYIDNNMATILVDFKADKKVRQDFNVDNITDIVSTNEDINKGKIIMEEQEKNTEEKDNKIELLAKYLKIDPSSISKSSEENTYDVEDEDAQYIVCTEDEAHDYAAEDIREIFNEMGLEAFSEDFQDWILNNAIDEHAFEDDQHYSNEGYADDIDEEADSEFESRLISEMYDKDILTDDDFNKDENGDVDHKSLKDSVDMEAKKEEFVNELDSQESPLDWAKEIYSDSDLAEMIKNNNDIDIDAVVEECIDEDGVAHFIASYDDEELDLGEGLFAYRIN
jgi:hypothetical protein